jgi:hypothetical protein
MGRRCSKNWGKEKCIQGFTAEPEGRRPLEDTGVVWRIILKWISEKLVGGIDWIYLVQDRDR